MSRRNKTILFVLLPVFLLLLVSFEDTLESAAASFVFNKLASLKALGHTPDFFDIKENEKIRIKPADGFLEAVVIFRPPSIAYDHIIVSKGLEDGVREGQLVLAGGTAIIGAVGKVFENSSRINSYSGYGLEQNVFLREAGVSASATGRGNGELGIVLPRDFPVKTGDKAFSLTDPSYLVGLVEYINTSASSPTKTLIIKQPFNIYEFFSVQIQL